MLDLSVCEEASCFQPLHNVNIETEANGWQFETDLYTSQGTKGEMYLVIGTVKGKV